MKIVGNTITETDVAMELCKKVQAEEYVIHVVGTTNFYTRLQCSLLASTWFPRPVGVGLWSAMHMLLVLYESLVLLFLVPTVFLLAVLMDALFVVVLVCVVLAFPFMVILHFLGTGVAVALVWLWLVITCKCCIMPGRPPGQSLVEYIFTTACGTVHDRPQVPQPVEGGAAAVLEGGAHESPWAALRVHWRESTTLKFVNHVILVSYPYRRAQLRDLCHEIVPWYDTIVI